MVTKIISLRLIITWSIISILSFFVLLGNGFIVIVNGHHWLQKRKMNPSDFLLICLSSSRVLSLLTGTLGYLLEIAHPETYQFSYTEEVMNFSLFVSEQISLWCSTWLSVLYCVKVTNFINSFFLWLKPRINVLAPRLLGISVIISMVASVPSLNRYYGYKRWCNRSRTLEMNISKGEICNNLFSVFQSLRFSLTLINFSLSAITSILLLISLWKHITNLRKSGAGTKDVSTQVHINVMKPLVCFLFSYCSYFMGMIFFSVVDFRHDIPEELIADVLISLFPIGHTIMLILTNPRLKKVSAHLLNIKIRVS